MVKRLSLILILLITGCLSLAAVTDTSPGIFNRRFRTLKTSTLDNFMSPNVIRLGTADRIVVTFDEIGEDNSYLEYRLIHCNSDWTPSRLVESEYLDGFNAVRIEDYAYSQATFVHYVNYRIEIPNENTGILHSGNYLLQVYDPDTPDDVILQTRFQASENLARVSGSATSRTDRGHNTEWQQLELGVDCEAITGVNPYQDILVEVMQNNREATRRYLRSPLRVDGKTSLYDHIPDLIYPASNEFRRFESVSNNFAGMNVDSLRFRGTNYHVWLKPDEERAMHSYQFDRTQHGRFIVREYNSSDSDIGADYITVHFALDFPELIGADIYIDGEFTNGKFDDSNRMTYDRDSHQYVAEIPLKQGAYNYQYVTLSRQPGAAPLTSVVEGNKYETDNEYDVSVYYRPPGARADRLVGFAVISTL